MRKSVISIMAAATLTLAVVVVGQQVGRGAAPDTTASRIRRGLPPSLLQDIEKQKIELKNQLQQDLNVSNDEMDVIWTKCETVGAAKFVVNPDTIKDLISIGHIPPAMLQMNGLPQGYNPDFSELSKALVELVNAEKDPAASPDVLGGQLNTVRQMLQKEQADLQAAKEDLRKIVTLKQEAMLMVWGYLN